VGSSERGLKETKGIERTETHVSAEAAAPLFFTGSMVP
jgi:hypothetical protein